MLRRLLFLPLLGLLALVSACGDSTGPSEASHVGTYTLRTINGEELPVVVFEEVDFTVEVTAGSITLNRDDTFRDQTTFRITEGGFVSTETETIVGTYTKNNNAIIFHTSDGDELSASLSGRTLTQTFGGFVLIYRK